MRQHKNLLGWAGISLCLIFMTGCSKQQKPAPDLPAASGQIMRCVLYPGVVYAYRMGESTNNTVFTEGRVDIYNSGLVIITDPDGTKHCGGVDRFSEITFK